MWSIADGADCSYIIAVNSNHNQHTAIISLRAHFVYVVFVLSISVQYMGCNYDSEYLYT